MKKFGLTVAAVAALGLAACNNTGADANNTADLNATENEAVDDVNASVNEAEATNTTLDALENIAEDAGNLAENAAEATANAADDATN